MGIFGIGIDVIIAIFFAVHVVRTNQNMYWLLILFMFPFVGSIVYGIAIYLPSIRHSRGAVVAKRVVRQAIDPGRELREARQAFELTPTVDRRLRYAAALLNAGDAKEALLHYREAAAGPFSRDPAVLSGLAQAQYATHDATACMGTLDTLFQLKPEMRRQSDLALLYARASAAMRHPDTRQAFQAALAVAGDPEPKCRYADWLAEQGDTAAARALYEEIVSDSRHWHHHAKTMNREWLKRAETMLARR